jgi:hypothetical protein
MAFKKAWEKLQHFFGLLNYIINFISNFTVEMLLKYNGKQRDMYLIIKKIIKKPKILVDDL